MSVLVSNAHRYSSLVSDLLLLITQMFTRTVHCILSLLFLLQILPQNSSFIHSFIHRNPVNRNPILSLLSTNVNTKKPLPLTPDPTLPLPSQLSTLRKIIASEYSTFFQPLYPNYYSDTVQFTDPMVNFEGLEKYEDNVKTIGGRNILGSILFEKDDSRWVTLSNVTRFTIFTTCSCKVTLKHTHTRFRCFKILTFFSFSNVYIPQNNPPHNLRRSTSLTNLNLLNPPPNPLDVNRLLQTFLLPYNLHWYIIIHSLSISS